MEFCKTEQPNAPVVKDGKERIIVSGEPTNQTVGSGINKSWMSWAQLSTHAYVHTTYAVG